MRTIFLLAFFFPVCCFAQQNSKVVTNSEPSYPKGDDALYTYVYYNLKFTEEAKQKNVTGDITVSFDVQPDSTTSNIMLLNTLGAGIDEEIKKMIAQMKFSPGYQNGKAVKMNTMYTFPIKAH